MKMLANVGPKGNPIPKPLVCLKNLSSKVKYEFNTESFSSSLKSSRSNEVLLILRVHAVQADFYGFRKWYVCEEIIHIEASHI